jgi:hypothetical protein
MTLKIKWLFNGKRKKKRVGVPVTRSYFYLFLSHRHVVLSRGTQRIRRKYLSAQTPSKSLYSLLCLFSRIYPTNLDICIEFQNCGSQAKLDISDQLDLSDPRQVLESWQLSRSDISDPPDLFGIHRVPEPLHPSLIEYMRPSWIWPSLNLPSDISNLGQIYPMLWHLQ